MQEAHSKRASSIAIQLLQKLQQLPLMENCQIDFYALVTIIAISPSPHAARIWFPFALSAGDTKAPKGLIYTYARQRKGMPC